MTRSKFVFVESDEHAKVRPTGLATALGALMALTVVQQIPPIREQYYDQIRLVLYGSFVALLCVSALLDTGSKNPTSSRLERRIGYLVLYIGFMSGAAWLKVGQGDLSEVVLVLVPLGVLACSLRTPLGRREVGMVLALYICLVLIMSVWTVISYGMGFQISSQYLVPSKNQIGPMIGLSVAVLAYGAILAVQRISLWARLLILVPTLVLLFACLLVVRNRAGVLAALVVVIGMSLERWLRAGAGARLRILAITSLTGGLLWATGVLTSITQFMLESFSANHDLGDADSLSAGRMEQYHDSLKFVAQNPLFGKLFAATDASIGQTPHNFVIDMLVKFGIIWAIPIIIFYAYLCYMALNGIISNRGSATIQGLASYCLLFSLVVSLFEYSAPFGPGVGHILVWFLLGQAEYRRVRVLNMQPLIHAPRDSGLLYSRHSSSQTRATLS